MASGSKGSTWGSELAAVVQRGPVRSSMLHLGTMSHLWRCNRVDVNIIMTCTIRATSTATWEGGRDAKEVLAERGGEQTKYLQVIIILW